MPLIDGSNLNTIWTEDLNRIRPARGFGRGVPFETNRATELVRRFQNLVKIAGIKILPVLQGELFQPRIPFKGMRLKDLGNHAGRIIL